MTDRGGVDDVIVQANRAAWRLFEPDCGRVLYITKVVVERVIR
jgi:hypothetical protein